MSITKNVPLNWYSSMKKKLRTIRMIFDIENWLWKSNCGTFWQLAINPKLKFWFLGKNLSDFVSPVWKLHNRYCHSMHCKMHWTSRWHSSRGWGYVLYTVGLLSPIPFQIFQIWRWIVLNPLFSHSQDGGCYAKDTKMVNEFEYV